jgi:outer membrane protein assembly factor BamB
MIRIAITVAVASLALAASVVAADDAPAWPQANGPFGNFNPRQYGVRLVDDLKDARLLWTSETNLLGRAKGSASGYVRMLADPTTHGGSASGLIVAEGRVFASSFRPRGDVWMDKQVNLVATMNKEPDKYTGEQLAALKRSTAADADDLTVAIDFATGKTLWTAIEEGKGLNRAAGKRLLFHLTPAYHDGRIFSMGTMGRVYCYSAADGKKLWEDDTGSLVKPSIALKQKMLAERRDLPGGQGMGASLVVAGGVLIVPQYPGGHSDVGLRGLDVKSGKTLWEVDAACSRFATPAVWTHGKMQYILTATVKGELRLIDPTHGKVLWTVGGLEPVYYSLSPSDRHVTVNVKATVNPKKGDGRSWGRIGCYRLSPDKAELAWSVPDQPAFWFENHMDICAHRRTLIRDGRVYYFTQNKAAAEDKTSYFFHILKEDTGEALFSSKPGEFSHPSVESPNNSAMGQFWLVEDRLLTIPDASHNDRSTLRFISIEPKSVRHLAPAARLKHNNTTAYEVFIELPYVDGRFLMRTWEGQVVCYDLRAPAN